MKKPATPEQVAAYLLRQGWTLHNSNAQWATYQKTIADRVVTLEVPQKADAIDYPRSFGILLDDLNRIGQAPIFDCDLEGGHMKKPATISVKEASKLLEVTTATIYNMLNDGRLRGVEMPFGKYKRMVSLDSVGNLLTLADRNTKEMDK